MLDVNIWMQNFLQTLNQTFENRVWFVGLQGSYARGEATPQSDIDVVVILDNLSPIDIQTYDSMLDCLPHRELICGFLSGRDEITHWETSDLFQFYHDTIPVFGSLDEIRPLIDENAVNRAIKIGVCNIFHGCIHNMLYEKSEEILQGLYKSASFVLQAIAYCQTGTYVRSQSQLLEILSSGDQEILETFLSLKHGGKIEFLPMSETLFTWAKSWIAKT